MKISTWRQAYEDLAQREEVSSPHYGAPTTVDCQVSGLCPPSRIGENESKLPKMGLFQSPGERKVTQKKTPSCYNTSVTWDTIPLDANPTLSPEEGQNDQFPKRCVISPKVHKPSNPKKLCYLCNGTTTKTKSLQHFVSRLQTSLLVGHYKKH